MTPPWKRPFCCNSSGRRSTAITTTPGSPETTSAPTRFVKPWDSSVLLIAAAAAGNDCVIEKLSMSCRHCAGLLTRCHGSPSGILWRRFFCGEPLHTSPENAFVRIAWPRRTWDRGGMSAPPEEPTVQLAAFVAGFNATWTAVFSYVLFGTYVGIGALAHDFGFSVGWALASTVLVWAGPAQVILISTLGAGGNLIEAAIAVTLSSVRLLPMVVALLPMLKRPGTRAWSLMLPAHFTATSIWVEALRLLPGVPRENRVAFCNGLGAGYSVPAIAATVVGYYLAVRLPPVLGAALP